MEVMTGPWRVGEAMVDSWVVGGVKSELLSEWEANRVSERTLFRPCCCEGCWPMKLSLVVAWRNRVRVSVARPRT